MTTTTAVTSVLVVEQEPKAENGASSPDSPVPKFIIPIIREIVENRFGPINYDLEYELGSNTGDGFIGVITRILVVRGPKKRIENGSGDNNNGFNPIKAPKRHSPQQDKISHGDDKGNHRATNGAGCNNAEVSGNGYDKAGVIVEEDGVPLFSLICKHLRRNPDADQTHLMDFFKREIFFYNNIWPEFERFQDEFVTAGERFESVPVCYFAAYNALSQEPCLLLEDLKVTGCQIKNKHESPDYKHVQKLMVELGKFHAISFALKKRKPEFFLQFQELPDLLARFMDSMKTLMDKNCRLILKDVLDSEKHPDFVRKRFERWRTKLWTDVEEITRGTNAEPFAVINHGDCWTNNLMFSYSKTSDEIDRLRFIDFQMCRYGSPVLDVFYFLFTCTDSPLRQKHFHDALDDYYASLSNFLQKLDESANELFPRATFLDHAQKFGIIGVAMATFAIPLVTQYALPDPSFSDKPEHDLMIENRETYREWMLGVVNDALQFQILREK